MLGGRYTPTRFDEGLRLLAAALLIVAVILIGNAVWRWAENVDARLDQIEQQHQEE